MDYLQQALDFLLFMVHGVGPIWLYFKFTKSILEGQPIEIFNNGNHKRDFTYIDDVVEVITRIIDNPSTRDKNGILKIQIQPQVLHHGSYITLEMEIQEV